MFVLFVRKLAEALDVDLEEAERKSIRATRCNCG